MAIAFFQKFTDFFQILHYIHILQLNIVSDRYHTHVYFICIIWDNGHFPSLPPSLSLSLLPLSPFSPFAFFLFLVKIGYLLFFQTQSLFREPGWCSRLTFGLGFGAGPDQGQGQDLRIVRPAQLRLCAHEESA